MHREQFSKATYFLLITTAILIGCLFITVLPVTAVTTGDSSAPDSLSGPPQVASPDFWQDLITAIRNLIAGVIPENTGGQSLTTTTGKESGNPFPGIPVSNQKVIAAYIYVYPGPDDDTFPLLMSVKDQIPWKKVNRIYLGFATVHDGELTDLPTGSSADDTARREENIHRIRQGVALCRQNNPDAEIFITSNFGHELDAEYNTAARDPQKFADSVLAYVKEYDLDGYDMDWESREIDDYAPKLTSLLSTCHDTFAAAGPNPHGRTYKLTHTVWPGVESAQTVAGLQDSVDQINIMSYGPGDGYDLASFADSYARAGFPYEKMIGGVESESGYPENGGPDTPASVAAKCVYVKDHNLAGLFEWRMDNDMRSGDGPPTFQITGWMSDCLAG